MKHPQKNKPSNLKPSPKIGFSVTTTDIYQGAIPSPKIMEGYKELDPSFPDRILKMAEKEQCHAHKMDKRVHFSVLSQTAIGLLAGLSAMTFLCYLVYFSIIHDHSGVAIAIVSAMAAIIGIFVYSHKKK